MTEATSKTPAPPKAGGDDPALIEVRKKTEEKIPQEMHAGYTAIVKAGMHILFGDELHGEVRKTIEHIVQQGSDPQTIANGMVKILSMIAQESQGQIDPKAMFPALITLTTYVLDYGKATMGMAITPDFIKAVITALAQTFAKSMMPNEGEGEPAEAQLASPSAGLFARPPQGVA